ncbi:MAG TPA: DISARM system SNF2-like helicase DrmD [Anaerolineae bacterium]|nr:DISARM system SNF2-like helicase DrmD [Anaerolineae bacterium]
MSIPTSHPAPKQIASANLPRVGMFARIRNRRAIVAAVEPYDGHHGRLHLVHLEYLDADGPPEDSLIWEREQDAQLLEPAALPTINRTSPMKPAEFDALQRATRWTALTPFVFPDNSAPTIKTPISAPLFGAIQAEDFQLVPLLKALEMPRISLLLADDVGLGKTVEAGLILTELLLRRRIRRVLIICPAALRTQWHQEMKDKFSLNFDLIDRAETHAIQKRLGLDANPWRTYSRIITSYYYLRQPDILEQFRAACQQPDGAVQLPWDLLIVDEAHNLTPANFGQDSDLSKMLRTISPWFEHKLFLTATPHNGHTRCFSGLLEQLDPVRFTQTSQFTPETQKRIEEVVIRRLKREINELDRQHNRPERFSQRIPEPLEIYFSPLEKLLLQAFHKFRLAVRKQIAKSARSEQLAGSFAVEVLNKRLLSSPFTFANSWHRFKDGIEQDDDVSTSEVNAARRSVAEDLDDDQEVEGRLQHAAKVTGAWLKPLAPHLTAEIETIDKILTELNLPPPEPDQESSFPHDDARWHRLQRLIQDRLQDRNHWLLDERLIIFTEYKTTLDYLHRRLSQLYPDDGIIRVLYGGMADWEREDIKQAFNDSQNPLRILVATDAASEGLNLQETARFVLHYDIPFNPARLDQRNGRLDRHGQARDVRIFHFTSNDDADLRFLDRVVQKVHTIREELGSMSEVFDAAFERRFTYLDDSDQILDNLDKIIKERQTKTYIPTTTTPPGPAEEEALQWLAQEIDLSPQSLQDTLEQALGLHVGLPRFDQVDEDGRVRLRMPLPTQWETLIDTHLRLPTRSGRPGALPALIFDPNYFVQIRNGRPVFRSMKDTVMLHLGHPLFQKTMSLFARIRYPGGDALTVSRWLVRYGTLPAGVEAMILVTIEELAVNELRESFHHWVRTIQLPIMADELEEPLPHQPAATLHASTSPVAEDDIQQAQEIWLDFQIEIKQFLNEETERLTSQLQQMLKAEGKEAIKEERKRFQHRLREVERAMNENTLQKLEKEWQKVVAEQEQLQLAPTLFFEEERAYQIHQLEMKQIDLEDELKRRRTHYEALRDSLLKEQQRVIDNLLPKRYQLRGQAQIFPVTIEIRLPEVSS